MKKNRINRISRTYDHVWNVRYVIWSVDLCIYDISFIQDSMYRASAEARMMYNRATKERLLLSLERNMLEWMRSLFHTQKPAQKDKWIMRSWTQMRKPNWLRTNNCKRLPQSRLTSDFLFFCCCCCWSWTKRRSFTQVMKMMTKPIRGAVENHDQALSVTLLCLIGMSIVWFLSGTPSSGN